jgi:endoplasmic reticulum-Golgi intermediate compartment protein 3
MFQYFVKVVSTKYKFLNETVVNTNQIAVTEHEKDTSLPGAGLPGMHSTLLFSNMKPSIK